MSKQLMNYLCKNDFLTKGGAVADLLISSDTLSIGNTRKLLNTSGYLLTCLCLVGLIFNTILWLAIVLLTVALAAIGFSTSGFAANHLDIAPRYAGIIMGLSNGIGTLSGIISPIAARLLVKAGKLLGWKHFFILSVSVEVFCVVFFLAFASGTVQSWAEDDKVEKTTDT